MWGPMAETADLRNYTSRTVGCLVVSVLGLLAVPYVGTRWGDFNEMIALIIGVAPMIYLLFFAISNLNQRVAELEKRK
jgi:accessory gene regulator protein AgrB